MAIKNLTKEHNETDFQRIKEIADMEWSLEDARAEIKAITEKAERELERYTKNTMGYEKLTEKHNNLVDKYGAKKNEVYDKVDEIRALQALSLIHI